MHLANSNIIIIISVNCYNFGCNIVANRKRLFEKVHHFVHLNLALSLLMANVLFVSGVEVAAKDEVYMIQYRYSV